MQKGRAERAVCGTTWPQSTAPAPVPRVTDAAHIHSKESIKAW